MIQTTLSFLASGYLSWSWWQIALATLFTTHVTIISVTVYLHRHQAHRAVNLNPAVAHFFRFWLWLTTGVLTGPWTAIHRKHHAKCETADDPHSPQLYGIWKVLLSGSELYQVEAKNEETLRRYGLGTPDDWLERHLYSRYPNLGISLLMVADVALFGIAGVSVWAIQMLWIPFWAGGVVNGLGHFWGYRNFGLQDASRNIVPIGILIGGEELHNNHHAYATSAKLSNRWYEFDIGWMYICLLAALKLAEIKKVAPKLRLIERKADLDDDTLQAVLRNRYEVIGTYVKAVERERAREAARAQRLKGHVTPLSKCWGLRHARTRCNDDPALRDDPQVTCRAHHDDKHEYDELLRDLLALWKRSNTTREELLIQLQEWCSRADGSGSPALRAFSSRLHRYN